MIALILALAATPAPPAKPTCITQDQTLVTIKEMGGEVVGSAHYAGAVTSDLLVVQLPNVIAFFGFNAIGCFVGTQIIEPAKPRTGA